MQGDSLVAQTVKHLSAVWETQVQYLGWEDPLEKEMATHSSTLAWRIPWMEEPGTSYGVAKSRTRLRDITFTLHRCKRQVLARATSGIKLWHLWLLIQRFPCCITVEAWHSVSLIYIIIESMTSGGKSIWIWVLNQLCPRCVTKAIYLSSQSLGFQIWNRSTMMIHHIPWRLNKVCVCARTHTNTQLSPTLWNPTDCSPPCSSVHGIFQARVLEWLPFPTPGDLSVPGFKPLPLVSPALAGGFFTTKPPKKPHSN